MLHPILGQAARTYASITAKGAKVAVLGAAGGIGQPLSMLLKQSELISRLSLYDVVNTPGVAADLSHINTSSEVTGYIPEGAGLKKALNGADIVVIPAGVPRKPGMTRDDLFNTNAQIVHDLAQSCAEVCPKAHILVISNPVNSTVPIVSEVFKKQGVYDPRRIFGVTTLDVVRASRFLSELLGIQPKDTHVTVVGGHSGATIIPLFSQVPQLQGNPEKVLGKEALEKLIYRVQYGGDEVVQAKNGTGSATLSMAFAGARFTQSLLRALVNGEKGVVEPTYVRSDVFAKDGVEYFSTNVELGPNGVEKIHELGNINDYERHLLTECVAQLRSNVEKGVAFVGKK